MTEENNGSLDALDFALLSHLQQDGRKSFTEIAQALDVSIGAVRNRVTRLIEEKTIQIVGRVDTQKVGFGAYAHIAVTVRPADEVERVSAAIAQLPEISFLANVSGDYDIEANVMCRDNEHLGHTLKKIRGVEGVWSVRTSLYLKVIKYSQPDLSLVRY